MQKRAVVKANTRNLGQDRKRIHRRPGLGHNLRPSGDPATARQLVASAPGAGLGSAKSAVYLMSFR
jgi:hypothetical protein